MYFINHFHNCFIFFFTDTPDIARKKATAAINNKSLDTSEDIGKRRKKRNQTKTILKSVPVQSSGDEASNESNSTTLSPTRSNFQPLQPPSQILGNKLMHDFLQFFLHLFYLHVCFFIFR